MVPQCTIYVICPKCAQDAAVPRAMNPDRRMTCAGCGAAYEFRQFREAWCESHRDELARRFPELAVRA